MLECKFRMFARSI